MPKTRDQKAELLRELDQTLAEAKGVAFANYQGLKVSEMEKLRNAAGEQAMSLRVTKNTILRLAVRKHGITIDEAILDQPLLMLASRTDEVGPAKILKTFAKEHEALGIAGGILGAAYLTATQVQNLADLPSRDQLRAQLVGLVAAPLAGLVRTLNAPLANLVSVLHQYQQQRAT